MDGFYISLLEDGNDGVGWDETQNYSPVGEQQPPVEQAKPSNRPPMNRRSKNFNEKEDKLLVSAWLNISMDAVQGNEQTRSTYWKRIHAYFHEHKEFESDCSQASLLHRWSSIQEHVNKFCGCRDQIERRRQSGVTEQDKIIQACTLYKEEEGKAFQYLHCWNELQHHPKWTDRLSQKKQKANSNASPGSSSPISTKSSRLKGENDTPTPESEPLARPVGRKAEKEFSRRGKSSSTTSGGDSTYMEALDNIWAKKREADVEKELKKAERYERQYALEVRKVEVQEREIELKRMMEDDRIMSLDISGMDELQQQYYTHLRREIIARRCSRSG